MESAYQTETDVKINAFAGAFFLDFFNLFKLFHYRITIVANHMSLFGIRPHVY